VILSKAKDLALSILQKNMAGFRFRFAQGRLRLFRMAAPMRFSAIPQVPLPDPS
jgi:hypothetical protein